MLTFLHPFSSFTISPLCLALADTLLPLLPFHPLHGISISTMAVKTVDLPQYGKEPPAYNSTPPSPSPSPTTIKDGGKRGWLVVLGAFLNFCSGFGKLFVLAHDHWQIGSILISSLLCRLLERVRNVSGLLHTQRHPHYCRDGLDRQHSIRPPPRQRNHLRPPIRSLGSSALDDTWLYHYPRCIAHLCLSIRLSVAHVLSWNTPRNWKCHDVRRLSNQAVGRC